MADNLPRAIDTKLAAIYAPAAEIMRKLEHARANLTAMHVRKDPARVADFNSRINELTEALDALDAAAAPYEAIYAETRWTRFFWFPTATCTAAAVAHHCAGRHLPYGCPSTAARTRPRLWNWQGKLPARFATRPPPSTACQCFRYT